MNTKAITKRPIDILLYVLIGLGICCHSPAGWGQGISYEETYDENFNKSYLVTVINNSNKTITTVEFSFTLVNFYYNMLDPRYREHKSRIVHVSIPPKCKQKVIIPINGIEVGQQYIESVNLSRKRYSDGSISK